MCWASRSPGQPRLIIQSDGEHSIVELVRQTCDELPRARQQVTPTASKGSNGRVKQANRAVEGMSRMIMQCLETRYDVEIPTGPPVVQWAIRHAAWLWERFQPDEDGLTGYYRQCRGTTKVRFYRLQRPCSGEIQDLTC